MNILRVILAIVVFFFSLILVRVFVWGVLDAFITTGATICTNNCGVFNTMGIIIQYLLTIGLLIFPPLMILQGDLSDKMKAMVKI